MKLKTIALFTLCYMGFSCAANADIYFRNFNLSNNFSKTQVDQYYADFFQPSSISELGQVSKLKKTNALIQTSSGSSPLQFQDKNGKVDLTSFALDGTTTLKSALEQGYNRILMITVHTTNGGWYDAAVGITPSFDPWSYNYNPSDVLLATIIDQSDQKKYGVDCRGNNPCAVVERIGTQ